MVSFDGVVKLCDFGIAKAAALGDQLTNPGQVKGKYAYMSPEQTIAAPLDGRSDVFSLAIVLWELLAGKVIIVPRGDAVEAMRAIRDGKLPPIEQVAPRTPPALAKAITWALADEARDAARPRWTSRRRSRRSSSRRPSSPRRCSSARGSASGSPRESTGQHTAIPGVSVGTKVAPGTIVARDTVDQPGTALVEGTQVGTITRARAAARRVAGPRRPRRSLDSAETVLVTDERARRGRRDRARSAGGPEAAGRRERRVTARDGATVIVDEPVAETVDETADARAARSARRSPGGPAALPTLVEPRLERRRTPVPAPLDTTLGDPRAGGRGSRSRSAAWCCSGS